MLLESCTLPVMMYCGKKESVSKTSNDNVGKMKTVNEDSKVLLDLISAGREDW